MKISLLLTMILAAGLVFADALPAHAGSFEVAPTTISIESESVPAVLYITNHGKEPIVAQVETYKWSQVGGKDQLDPTDDIIISPPMARLMPDQQQTVRLLVKPVAGVTVERSYRLLVSEIPDATSGNPRDKIRMLLQFSVPVFVDILKDAKPQLGWSAKLNAEGLTLCVHNTGTQHAKISDIAVETNSGQSLPVADGKFQYILPGDFSSWTLSASSVSAGQAIHIKAYDEATRATTNTSLLIQ